MWLDLVVSNTFQKRRADAMTRKLTWDMILSRKNLIGGDIESVERDNVYRGPISEFRRLGNKILIISPWCGRLNDETGKWENCDSPKISIDQTYDSVVQMIFSGLELNCTSTGKFSPVVRLIIEYP